MSEIDCGNADDKDDEFVSPNTFGVEEKYGRGCLIVLYTFALLGAISILTVLGYLAGIIK